MWKQLQRSIQDTLSLRAPTELDVMYAMNKVLALQKAYPLPLLPGMLEKFPKKVDPACWWPKLRQRRPGTHQRHFSCSRTYICWPSYHRVWFIRCFGAGATASTACGGRRFVGDRGEHLGARGAGRDGVRAVPEQCRLLQVAARGIRVRFGGGRFREEGEWGVIQVEAGFATRKEPLGVHDFVPYAAACKDEDIKEFAGKLF
ncbi:hypothetical protein OPV22_013423 [Ensete ventricosum]|uniref:Uncharacterized protein n=1 Tax=Ensete ventricosum TaxID=4639 RepID=A0AAV8R5E7_ENSVE|nr:hypothetical protein OPV22_013423 [Ensete ventricosum]